MVLDAPEVYLSQINASDLSLIHICLCTNDKQGKIGEADGRYPLAVIDILPVSYTHLDVYKRQPLGHRGSSTGFCADNMVAANRKDKSSIFFMFLVFKSYLVFMEALMR